MQIDRARFLLLTASLAGGGCSASPATTGPSAPPTPTPSGTEMVVPEVPETSTELMAHDQVSALTTSTTTSDDTTTSQTASGPCDNDAGTVPACSILPPPGPFCESLADTKAYCKTFKTSLRTAIAEKAVSCLNAASKTQDICDFSKSESCASEAIRTACVQPSTFNACSPVVATCAGYSWSKLSMNDCQQLLSAVKDGKRQSMITCMTEGCSLESCTWMLR
ncbi:MAG: hypothetical protein U0441_05645 [Polyangiaceae bacterium]